MHRMYAASVGDAEAAEADYLFVYASPLCDDGVIEVGDFFERAALAIVVLAFIGEIEALFCSLRFLFAPSIKTVCEQGASFAVDTKHGMAAVGHAFAVGIQGLDAMVFDEEPRHGSFDRAFLVFVGGSLCLKRGFLDRVLLRRCMDGGHEREIARQKGGRSEQEGDCERERVELFHGLNLLF